eukprot:CAMPEP_0194141334 /NCGR_PEP_ID=MMETSP0152-20130528/10747_1 /TAXON_ID=1049557 /ORGANISM="Thalassiothrix antarctica, Strain L6-D1" /LENGTH=1325 /DNA_ID=CAMNT_0038839915 /DNA_START=84 /DNA_END=4061 /DNA_ORIENTATION=-
MSSLRQSSRAVKSTRKAANIDGAVPYLSYSFDALDPSSALSSLKDNQSNYSSVARSCLQLNQYAGSSDQLQHDASYAKTTSSTIIALSECLVSHIDRRCRILAAKTLALCARAAYSKIRHSPLLFSIREGTLRRLEDEVGTDAPAALCTAALEDRDEGVAVSAVEALSILTLSSAARAGTIVEDELTREVQSIAFCRQNPFTPSLVDCSDEDPSIPQMELACRIYENVLVPRIWRLVHRILLIESPDKVSKTLPFLTSCLVHLMKLMPSTTLRMDRNTYAKRWIEVDIVGLINLVVTSIIIPTLSHGSTSSICHALCGLRFAHVCPNASWTLQLCNAAIHSIVADLSLPSLPFEQIQSLLASLLIALRAIPLIERPLELVLGYIRYLPATVHVPLTVTSLGVQVGKYRRRSARIGLLTEVALSLIIDRNAGGMRDKVLKKLLSGSEVTTILNARGVKKGTQSKNRNYGSNTKTLDEIFTGTDIGEEFVLSLCKVTSSGGQEILKPGCYETYYAEDWLRCALTIVSSNCANCLNWKSRIDYDGPLITMLTACQAAYIQLLVETFHVAGCICPQSSVTIHLLPHLSPFVLMEDLAHAIVSLTQNIESNSVLSKLSGIQDNILNLVDHFLEYKIREGILSRHMRITIISLLSDHWVKTLDTDGNISLGGNSPPNIRDSNARELLTILSEEMHSLTQDLSKGTGDKSLFMHYLEICVASVENIALKACAWTRRNSAVAGRNDKRSKNTEAFCKDLDEDVTSLLLIASAALEGKNLRKLDEIDSSGVEQQDDPFESSFSKYPVFPVCVEAIKRMKSISLAGLQGAFDKYGIKPSPHSLLVARAKREFQKRLTNNNIPTNINYAHLVRSPFTLDDSKESAAKESVLKGDARTNALFLQHCLQCVGSRIDLSLQASSLVGLGFVGKAKCSEDGHIMYMPARTPNSLRLSALPLVHHSVGTPLGARVSCPGSVHTLSGSSDPISFIIAYSMRRCLRYDCEMEFKLFVTCRVHNVTATKIRSGLRVDLRVGQQRNRPIVEEEEGDDLPASHTAVFKQEIKSNDFVTWEVALTNWPLRGSYELHSSVTFREMDAENILPKPILLIPPKDDVENGSNCDTSGLVDEDERTNHTYTDDTAETSIEERTIGDEEEEKVDITLVGEPVKLSPMTGLQPSPLVFFRDRRGDVNTFRFMWHQMEYKLPEITLCPDQNTTEKVTLGSLPSTMPDEFGAAIANLSRLAIANKEEMMWFEGNVIRGWAFQSLSSDAHLLCLTTKKQSNEEKEEFQQTKMYFRSDDETLLQSVLGSDTTRDAIVSCLMGNKWNCISGQGDGLFSL